MTQQIDFPDDWQKDDLSHLFAGAIENIKAAFVFCQPQFNYLSRNYDAFRSLLATSIKKESEFPMRFFTNHAHASFISASMQALSGMLPASYMSLRGCLESALYGCYVADSYDRFKIWGDRNRDDEARKLCRNEFTLGNVMGALEKLHKPTHDIARRLYEWLIDFGGHPNQRAIMSQLAHGEEMAYVYLYTGEDMAYKSCWKTVASVGVCSLEIFRYADPARVASINLEPVIDGLKSGL